MCTSYFRSAKLTGFRFYRTSIRAERFYICRSEMYHEPAKKDRSQLRQPHGYRATIRTTPQRKLGIVG